MGKYRFISEYSDMILGADSLDIGSEVEVAVLGEGKASTMKIIHKVSRNSNVIKYDYTSEAELIAECPVEFDVSGEFVTDNDMTYVFLKE